MLKTKTIAALAATSVLAAFAPATLAQTGKADDAYYQSGPWRVLDRAKIFCEIEHSASEEGRLTLSKSSTEAAYFSFYANEQKDYNTPSAGIVWLFDSEPVAGHILAGRIYQVSNEKEAAEVLFRKASILKIVHADETVAEIDLKGSAAAFRQLKKCADQYPGSRVPMIPPPAPPIRRLSVPQPAPIPEPDLDGPFEPSQQIVALNPGMWVRSTDYLGRFLRQDMGGSVGLELAVSKEGRVVGCSLSRSSGYPELDSYTCDLVTQRARFQPPTDSKAKRVEGSYATNIRWSIPE